MKKIITSVCIVFAANFAYAYTECTVNIERMWAGDSGWIWLFYEGGGSAKISPTDEDQKNIMSFAMTALATGNTLIVRYHADGVSCRASAQDGVRGVYLLNRAL